MSEKNLRLSAARAQVLRRALSREYGWNGGFAFDPDAAAMLRELGVAIDRPVAGETALARAVCDRSRGVDAAIVQVRQLLWPRGVWDDEQIGSCSELVGELAAVMLRAGLGPSCAASGRKAVAVPPGPVVSCPSCGEEWNRGAIAGGRFPDHLYRPEGG